MPLIFSYGTLQQERVQLATFGRLLAGQPDQLSGYRQVQVPVANLRFVVASGQALHASADFTGRSDDHVVGTVFDVTDEELAMADRSRVKLPPSGA